MNALHTAAAESIPVAPSMGPALEALHVPAPRAAVDRRVVLVSGLAIAIAGVAFLAAELLTALIAVITNLAFFGRIEAAPASPAEHHVGALVLVVPIAGALVVGVMARYGSQAIRGHGILVDGGGELVGVVTQRDVLTEQPGALAIRDLIRRSPAVVFEDSSLREAADHMVTEGVGRLPVVSRQAPRKVLGMLTRSDLLDAHRSRIEAAHRREQPLAAAERRSSQTIPPRTTRGAGGAGGRS